MDPNAPEAEGCRTQACGLALWRWWLLAVLGAPVMLTQWHGRAWWSFTKHTSTLPQSSKRYITHLLSMVCILPSRLSFAFEKAGQFFVSMKHHPRRPKLKILGLRQLLWLGPIYELPVEACSFKRRANPNWFRKSWGQGMNIILQPAACCACSFYHSGWN